MALGLKRIVLQWLLLLLIAGAFFYIVFSRHELLNIVAGIEIEDIFFLAIISICSILSNSLTLKVVLNSFNVFPSLKECFGISSVNSMGNYLFTWGGGTVGKALYLKKRHGFSYSSLLSSTAATYILDLLCASVLGMISLTLVGGLDKSWGRSLFAGFFFLGILSVVLAMLPVSFTFFGERIGNVLREVAKGWRQIKGNRRLICKLVFLLLTNQLLNAAEIFVSYRAFSINVDMASSILMGVIASLSIVIKLTPANLGVQEGVIAFSSHMLGIGFGEGLLAAGLIRVVSLCVIFILGGFCSFFMFGTERKSVVAEGDQLYSMERDVKEK